jgi:hypothetical protein
MNGSRIGKTGHAMHLDPARGQANQIKNRRLVGRSP